ncbi:MAG: MarR family transcriptional regulator [Actinobacteria bacterium]|nr:MarR family transcriptional regulator [Actinomycetota bacterium]
MAKQREPDHVDRLITQWSRERPDLELAPMATIGRLGRLHALVSRSIADVFATHGLQIGEFDVLAALRRSGEPFTMKPTDLAHVLMLSPAGMTNRVDRLEAAGWIERRSDPDDRRSSLVHLTDAGRDVVDRAVTDHVANEARLLEPLSTSERTALDTALRTLLHQFDTPSSG